MSAKKWRQLLKRTTSRVPSRTFTRIETETGEVFRSQLELSVATQLKDNNIVYQYETEIINYIRPAKVHKYKPDFILQNGVIVEVKGLFDRADRQKHLLIQEQRPDLDIRFVFQNSKQKIVSGSKTSYAMWCVKFGFKYHDKTIPLDWLK